MCYDILQANGEDKDGSHSAWPMHSGVTDTSQMVALLRRCPQLYFASLAACLLTSGLLLWSPAPHVSFLYQIAEGTDVLCLMRYKRLWKTPDPYIGLHLLYIIRGWIGWYLINQFLGQCASYSTMIFKNFRVLLGLEFSVDLSPILFLVHVPAKTIENVQQQRQMASIQTFTFHHQCNGPILLMWGKAAGTGLMLRSHNIVGLFR